MRTKYHITPGDKFYRLTAVKLDHIGPHNRSYFLFKCECGNEKVILGSLVKSGNTKSCGCYSREVKKAKTLADNRGVINHLILQYKRHARRRNLSFDLTYEQFSSLISKDCHYCTVPPSNNKVTKNCPRFLYSGIDRVDSSVGYSVSNCVPCCDYCNKAKGNKTLKDFAVWAIRVSKRAMAEQWGYR